MADLLKTFSQTDFPNYLDLNLVKEALNTFHRCVCFPEQNWANSHITELVFSSSLLLVLSLCGTCSNEVRWTKSPGSRGRKLLLISDSKQDPVFFNYSDVILLQSGQLLRLDLPLASGRNFIPFHQAASLYKTGSLANFEGRNLKVHVFECSPLIRIVSSSKGIYWGFEVDLMSTLAERLNFTIKYLEINRTDVWGLETNNTWAGGILGDIVDGTNDIGVCGVYAKQNHLRYFDVITYGQVQLVFIISDLLEHERWKSIYSPFSLGLWECVLFTMVLSFSAMFLLSKLSGNKEGLTDWFFLVLGHYLACVSLPWRGPVPYRTAITMVAIAALFISTLYCSAIVSHLTHPPVVPPPATVKDLVEGDYHWSRSRPVFDPRDTLNEEDVWQRKFIKNYRNVSDMGPAVEKQRFAFAMNQIDKLFIWKDLPTIAFKKGNALRTMEEIVSTHYVGLATRKGSIITEHFSLAMERLNTFGIIHKFRIEKEEFIRRKMPSQETEHFVPLTLEALQGAFFLLVSGLMLSVIAFIGEIFYSRRHKKKGHRIYF